MKNSVKYKDTEKRNTYRTAPCSLCISLLCVFVFRTVFHHDRLATSPTLHSCMYPGRFPLAAVATKMLQELSSFEPLVTSTPSGARPPPCASPKRAEAQPGNGAVDDKAALAELQQEFDTFKKEMGENHRRVSRWPPRCRLEGVAAF